MSTAPPFEGLLELESREQKRGESAPACLRFKCSVRMLVEPVMRNEGKARRREGELGMARGEAWMSEGGKERMVVPRSEAFEETGGQRGTDPES